MMQNPFQLWQQMAQQMMSAMPTMCAPNTANSFSATRNAMAEPFSFSNMFAGNDALQQQMAFWQAQTQRNVQMLQQFWGMPAMEQPSAFPMPKITIMTVELGDLRPFIGPAMQMVEQLQRQMFQSFSGGR